MITMLEFLRRKKGWNQFDLAKKIDKHPAYLCRIEKQSWAAPSELQNRIAVALNANISDLFFSDGTARPLEVR